MISKTLQDAFNEQINKELFSSYLYLSMAAWCEDRNLPGFASWLAGQEAEERSHAMKLYKHLADRGGRIELKPIAGPRQVWSCPMELFKEVQAHEQAITSAIGALYETAVAEKDYPGQILLQWFIAEQVEEEKTAAQIVHQLQLIEDHGTAVLMLDHQLAKRGKA